MEAATPLRTAHVAVLANRLVVDGLVVEDPTAVQVVRERVEAGEDPAKVVGDAIEIGARVLDREQAGATVELVQAELEKTTREQEAVLTEATRRLAEAFGKKFDDAFGAENGQLNAELRRLFGDDSAAAVQHKVKAVMTEVANRSREDLLRQFSSADGTNPLADFKAGVLRATKEAREQQAAEARQMRGEVVALREMVQALRAEKEKAAEVAAEFDKSTMKGRPYEEAVFDAIDEIARGQGDDADPTGDEKGTGGKKGDVVVGIDGASGPAKGRNVFEAKNSNAPSKKVACEYLDEAMRTRDAGYGVWVVPSADKLPSKCPSLREFGGDKVFAIYDSDDGSTLELEVAYKLARFRALAAAGADGAVDAGALRGEIEKALQALDNCRRIKLQLTTAAGGVKEAREILGAMEDAVRDQLTRIDGLLAAADDALAA